VLLHFEAGIYTDGNRPYSVVWVSQVPLDQELLEVGPFVGIPRLTQPTDVVSLGSDYSFAWSVDGGVAPDVYSMRMLGPDLAPAWRLIMPGALTGFALPHVPGIFEIVPAAVPLHHRRPGAGLLHGLLRVQQLSVRAWDGWL